MVNNELIAATQLLQQISTIPTVHQILYINLSIDLPYIVQDDHGVGVLKKSLLLVESLCLNKHYLFLSQNTRSQFGEPVVHPSWFSLDFERLEGGASFF